MSGWGIVDGGGELTPRHLKIRLPALQSGLSGDGQGTKIPMFSTVSSLAADTGGTTRKAVVGITVI